MNRELRIDFPVGDEEESFIEFELERRRVRVPVGVLLLLRELLLRELAESTISREEFYRSGYLLRRILEKRIDYYITRKLQKVIAVVATLSITTITSLHAIRVGFESGFPSVILAGITLLSFTLYWVWKLSKISQL